MEALVFGSGITALGVLRCLGRRGIHAGVVPSPTSPPSRSRWQRPTPTFQGGSLQDYLFRFVPSPRVLIPCSDDWVRVLAEAPPAIKERYPSSVPPLAVLDRLLDKGSLAELLQAEGIPHPRTVSVRDGRPDTAIPFEDGFFVKPRDSLGFHQHYGVKAFWPDSQEDLWKLLGTLSTAGFDVVLQEYVPGPASNHYFVDGFVDAGHDVRAVFVRQRIRMYPPRFGNSTYMVSIPRERAEEAVAATMRLLKKLEYRGVFSAEFKWDDRDGLFKMLEVNVRPWWFVEFAANCGVNVVEMAYRDALGETVEEVRDYRVGRFLIYPYFDMYACRSEESSRATALLGFLRSVPGAEQPVFNWEDPLPGLFEVLGLIRGFVSRRVRSAVEVAP